MELKTRVNEICSRERVVAITREILSEPSPQTELFEAEPQVLEFIAGTVRPYLEGLGIQVDLDERGNLTARLGSPGSRTLMLVGYAMTPQEGAMAEGYLGQVVAGEPYGYQEECLRGRGSCEQKGALGAMLVALAAVAEFRDRLGGELVFICSTAGETGRHDSLEFIVERQGLQAGKAILGLGTNNEVCLGNKGRVDVKVTVNGRACHSSVPQQGINAVTGAAEVIQALNNLKPQVIHPSLGSSTLAPMYIESFPRATHTIQDRCIISYDRRLVPGESPDQALDEIREVLSGIKGYQIQVERGPFMYPSEIARESIIAQLVAEAVESVCGRAVVYTYFNSALDAGLLNRQGIEALMFGPGDVKFAHTAEEVVPVNQVVDAARIYALTALSYLGIQ